MHMRDWVQKLDAFLRFNEREILTHKGTITAELAKEHACREFDKFEEQRRALEANRPTSDFDHLVDEAKQIEGRAAVPNESTHPAAKLEKRLDRRKKSSE
jgi:hypothetical protein